MVIAITCPAPDWDISYNAIDSGSLGRPPISETTVLMLKIQTCKLMLKVLPNFVTKVRSSRRDERSICMGLLTGMFVVCRRPQPVEVSEVTGVRGSVRTLKFKHPTLISVIYKELHHRKLENRANATSTA